MFARIFMDQLMERPFDNHSSTKVERLELKLIVRTLINTLFWALYSQLIVESCNIIEFSWERTDLLNLRLVRIPDSLVNCQMCFSC